MITAHHRFAPSSFCQNSHCRPVPTGQFKRERSETDEERVTGVVNNHRSKTTPVTFSESELATV